MGGKSKSSSSTDNSVDDSRVAAADDGVAVGAGGALTVNTVDAGAIETAGDLASRALDLAEGAGARADAIAAQAASDPNEDQIKLVTALGAAALAAGAIIAFAK